MGRAHQYRSVLLFLGIFIAGSAMAQSPSYTTDTLIVSDHFDHGFDSNRWIIEKSDAAEEKVAVQDGKLLLDTYGGATVWLKKELSGNYLIRFRRKIIIGNGKNDRLSDCNQFWMATDPLHNKLFQRKGAFNEYDSLSMYYVGMGGNYNTTTRFRKYDGKGEKKIIGEYTDSLHLLQPNKEYLIEIIIKDGTSTFKVDGQVYFSYKDPSPLLRGWFAFRSTRSRQEIDDLEVYRIK
jgi:rhamnogalacturonan endolyase